MNFLFSSLLDLRTVADRARWVLDFMRQDFHERPPPEGRLMSQVLGFVEQGFPPPGASFAADDNFVMGTTSKGLRTHVGIKPTLMKQLQGDARTTISQLQGEPGRVILRKPPRWIATRRGSRVAISFESGDLRVRFKAALLLVLADQWHRFKQCKHCDELFLPPRSGYCSDQCSQNARWKKFAATRQRDYHAEYVARTKKKLGAKVRPSRRPRKTTASRVGPASGVKRKS